MSEFRYKVTTAPAVEPVTTEEAKTHLRIPSSVTAEDTLIDAFVTSARKWVERYLNRKLITQTVTEYLDRLPGGRKDIGSLPPVGRVSDVLNSAVSAIELAVSPVQSITSIETFNEENTATEWASSNYTLSDTGEKGRVYPANSASWPTYTRSHDAIKLVYVVGYGDASSDIPAPIVEAIKMLVAASYENRGDADKGTWVPAGVKSLLAPYRVLSL